MSVTLTTATDDQPCPNDVCEEYEPAFEKGVTGRFVDDITGKVLQPELVRAGRDEELRGFYNKPVYHIIVRVEAKRRGLKILGTRWVDKLKGSKVRSRLCAQDFNFGKRGDDVDLFAPTPPLVAARYVVSRTASCGWGRRTRRRLLSLD